MKKFLCIVAALFFCLSSQAQQEGQYTQYLFNGLAINPAYAGSHDQGTFSLLMRKQWHGIRNAPVTGSFFFHTPLERSFRHGVGVSVVNDLWGANNQLRLNLAYSYRIPFKKVNLAMGIQAGGAWRRTDYGEVDLADDTDVAFSGNIQNIFQPVTGAGLYLFSDRFFVGLSMPNLISHTLFDPDQVQNIAYASQLEALFTAGVVIPVSKGVKIKPSTLIKLNLATLPMADINLSVIFLDKIMAGVSWRSFESVAGMFQWQVSRNFRFGYAYDYPISDLRTFSSGSHELMLGVDLISRQSNMTSPRYIYF